MRIHRNPLLVAKSLTKNTIKKLSVASLATVLVAGGVLLAQNLTTPDQALALTPPDSCFAFNVATKTITDYYDNQANNPANPACPRDVDIPSTIGGVAVTEIGVAADEFYPAIATSFANKSLTSVTIPSSVTKIGQNSFRFNQLTSVTVPSSVTLLESLAFADNDIKSVIFNGTVATFGDIIFRDNPVESITYGGVEYKSSDPSDPRCFALSGNSVTGYKHLDMKLIKNQGASCLTTDITIPSNIGGVPVTSIGGYAFLSYTGLITSVAIPSSVTTIGDRAFSGNSLSSIIIPNSVTNVGDAAFSNNQLASVIIPNSLTTIGNQVFEANDLTAVNIPSSVATIGDRAFHINKLTSLEIPNTVLALGKDAFSGNYLSSLVLPDSITMISEGAFDSNYLTSVTLGDAVTSIGSEAFSYNMLSVVDIPSSVTSIAPDAFFLQNQWGADIGDWSSGAPYIGSGASEVQRIYDTISYVHLNLEDTSNTHNLTNGYMNEGWWMGYDANEDGQDDSLGGHLVNSSRLTVSYKNSSGQALSPSQTYVGATGDSSYLLDYLAVNGPSIPAPYDPSSPTPAEQAAIDQALSSYYSIGDQVTITPPAVSGYVTPPAKTFTLSSTTNQGTFTYKKPLTTVNFSQPSGSATNPTANSVPASLPVAMANSTFTVDTAEECSAIDTARLLPASDFKAPDADNTTYTTLGGLDFTLSCTEPGKDAKVSLALASEVSDPTTVKVYKQTASGTVTDITNQTTITNQAGKTTISYNLTDGGELDDDGAVNGTITDPIYLTVPLKGNEALLADTGASLWLYGGAAAMLILAAIGLVVANRRILSRR